MSLAERVLEGATVDHVALSVGNLDALTQFYERVGFQVISRSDFAPAPVRSALLRTPSGAMLELTEHGESVETAPVADVLDAARRRGFFHLALRVRDLTAALSGLQSAGARLVVSPGVNSRGDARFAYIADPEGNLIELVSETGPVAAAAL